ncbi:MAG: leucine-rich repeat domain-containing protein [Treponema sp.]|jgi:hypothetical protein|nr:leucine-rich repeat domain-containing protein [Treponema sp.]
MKKRYFAAAIGALFIAAALFGQNAADFEYEAGNGKVTITGYRGSKKNVTIPKRINNLPITAIGRGAFEDSQITNVPGSVTEIGEGTFAYNQLTGVAIPNSVTAIGDSAFEGNQLTAVTIPDSVTTIGAGAFWENRLTGVTISNSVTTIGDLAFAHNWTLPHSVDTIKQPALS